MQKDVIWVLGWRPKQPYLCTPWARKGVFGYLEWWCLKWSMPENIVCVLGWRPKHPYPSMRSHRGPENVCFRFPGTGVFEMDNAKKYRLRSGVAPQTTIPLHTMGPKGCYCPGSNRRFPKTITGFGGQLNLPTPLRFASASVRSNPSWVFPGPASLRWDGVG